MTVPVLTGADLELLQQAFPDLQLDDAERRAVLLEPRSRDVNAAPGSGKTTLLAAKLYLLARSWPHTRRGICVISHTNVARDEIAGRLAATTEGSRLFAYPHFLGTIHAFVNQYLALPLLRSQGIDIDIIDNEAFARSAVGMAQRNWTIRTWMAKNFGAEAAVATMQYNGADLEVTSAEGALPGPDSRCGAALREIKGELSTRGVFRHEDMFAFAERLLRESTQLPLRLSHRFPMVLIDEMQDTSGVQEELLTRLFDAGVVLQRFGDVNQNILSSNAGVEKVTFPRGEVLNVRTSKRFGASIAAAVSAVQLDGAPVIGEGATDRHKPTLLLYGTARVTEVIPQFGRLVLRSFSDEALLGAQVRALCMRKKGDAKATPGRHLGDYWPAFALEAVDSRARQDSLWALLGDPKLSTGDTFNVQGRAADVRRAVLLVLRAAKSAHVDGVRDARALLRSLQAKGVATEVIRRVCRDLAVARGLTSSDAAWEDVIRKLHIALVPLLPDGIPLEQFSRLEVFAKPQADEPPPGQDARECLVEHDGRRVRIAIGTTASMKGETHLATLVLESHGGNARRFDLAQALPVICGATPVDPKLSPLHRVQFRNMYVAMSRPSHLLCLAMNAERTDPAQLEGLAAKGWAIEYLV